MKILLIGNGADNYILQAAESLKINYSCIQVDVFHTQPHLEIIEKHHYDNIFLLYPYFNIFKKRFIFSLFCRYIRPIIIKKNFNMLVNDYDIIHIHFVHAYLADYIEIIICKGKKVIASIWGSDLLRSTPAEDKKRAKIYDSVQNITMLLTDSTRSVFIDKYSNRNLYKISTLFFGSNFFKVLKQVSYKYTKKHCKLKLNLDSHKIVITIGYNASNSQRHFEIIENITNFDRFNIQMENIQFVFPLTYGNECNYKKDLFLYLNKKNINYILFEDYLNEEELALLRYASDIYIHLPTTDFFCSSFREYLYAKNIVISGSWLPYESIRNDGFLFHTVDHINEIGEKLYTVIDNFEEEKNRIVINDERLLKYSDWDIIIKKWMELYTAH